MNTSFSFFITILFILIIFYIFNYQYYSKYYNYHSEINTILFENFDKKYFQIYCNYAINDKCFIDDTNLPTSVKLAEYFSNLDFNVSDLNDINELNNILDKYIKTLITHQLIIFFHNKHNKSKFKDIDFCTYFDTNNINYNDKLPNIFYCLNYDNSQPFKFFNDFVSDYDTIFKSINDNLTKLVDEDKLYYKEHSRQYIINEYTKKINKITNNIHNIKDTNFNETYIILFIICVIIVYTILLFLI